MQMESFWRGGWEGSKSAPSATNGGSGVEMRAQLSGEWYDQLIGCRTQVAITMFYRWLQQDLYLNQIFEKSMRL